jgi:hypothetical protein
MKTPNGRDDRRQQTSDCEKHNRYRNQQRNQRGAVGEKEARNGADSESQRQYQSPRQDRQPCPPSGESDAGRIERVGRQDCERALVHSFQFSYKLRPKRASMVLAGLWLRDLSLEG